MSAQTADLVAQWLAKAEADFTTACILLEHGHAPTEAICFHAQQTIEKFFKAALVFIGSPVRRTHDLGKLIEELSEAIPSLAQWTAQADLLSNYAVEVRYPDQGYRPTKGEAEEAVEIARAIRVIIRATLDVKAN